MTELKTIKDLDKSYTAQITTDDTATVNFVSRELYEEFKDKPYSFEWINGEELREEAKKYVVDLRLAEFEQDEKVKFHYVRLRLWIMYFFNISEEDLK